MSFSQLPETVRLIYETNFTFFGKLFLLFIIVAWSFYYLWFERYEKKLEYILSDKVEILKLVTSKIILFTLPLWIFVLFPQVGIDPMIQFTLGAYGLIIVLFMVVAFIGTIYYGPVWGLRFAGLDLSRKQDQGVMKELDKYFPKKELASLKSQLKKK